MKIDGEIMKKVIALLAIFAATAVSAQPNAKAETSTQSHAAQTQTYADANAANPSQPSQQQTTDTTQNQANPGQQNTPASNTGSNNPSNPGNANQAPQS